jgi:hypothetical protein
MQAKDIDGPQMSVGKLYYKATATRRNIFIVHAITIVSELATNWKRFMFRFYQLFLSKELHFSSANSMYCDVFSFKATMARSDQPESDTIGKAQDRRLIAVFFTFLSFDF